MLLQRPARTESCNFPAQKKRGATSTALPRPRSNSYGDLLGQPERYCYVQLHWHRLVIQVRRFILPFLDGIQSRLNQQRWARHDLRFHRVSLFARIASIITTPRICVCLASGGYVGSARVISLGSRTLPPTRTGAFGPAFLGVSGATPLVFTPPITPPITPPTAPPPSKSGGSGASLMSAIVFGTTVGAISFPAFSKTRCAGACFICTTAGAGGGGGGGGGRSETYSQIASGSVCRCKSSLPKWDRRESPHSL